MNQRVLDLSRLNEFVSNTLRTTEDVKNILQTQCEEAKFVLAPWQLETITKRELDRSSCTCVRTVSSEDHVKEIANGIDRAVAQARRLREKLAINVLEERKLARKPNVQQIYAPSLKKIQSKAKLVESKAGKENGSTDSPTYKPSADQKSKAVNKRNESLGNWWRKQRSPINKAENLCPKNKPKIPNVKEECKGEKVLTQETRQSSSNTNKKITEPKRITDKKLIGTSPYNSLVAASKAEQKSKGKKNFIAANKSNIKNIRTSKSLTTSNFPTGSSKNLVHISESSASIKSSDTSICQVPSAAEFESLISKISLESDNSITKSAANLSEGNDCPVHNINAPKYVEEKIYTSIDVAEGLDQFGVPPELVKILKVYHSYLNSQSASESGDKRGKKAKNKYLEKFDAMNRARHEASTIVKLDNLCKDFLPVFNESFNRKMDFIELSRLKIRYTDLDTACKALQIRRFSPTKRKISNMIENRCEKSSLESYRTWRLNSVWNEVCLPTLEGMSHARCIRYSKKNQLLEFFDFVQRLQQLEYQAKLIDLLVNEVIPLVRESLEPTSKEFVNVYKMISIISNLLHLKVPVLVRTDK